MEDATILNSVVLHDVTTGRVLLPAVQFVYQGEEVAPQVLQRAWLTVHLRNDGSVMQLNSTHPDARVNDFHISNDEATGETLHVEGLFPFEVPEPSHLSKTSYELLQEFQQRGSFIRSLLTGAAEEGLFTLERSLDQDHNRWLGDGAVNDGIEGFVDIQPTNTTNTITSASAASSRPYSPSPSSVFSALGSSSSSSSSSILSPQPQLKQQQLLDQSQSPLSEREGRLRGVPRFGVDSNLTTNDINNNDYGDDRSAASEYDLARSEAERGQLKDIVLKFHRDRHALLSPQEEDDFTSLPLMPSATTPNRNSAPSPYPYHQQTHPYGPREDLSGVGAAGTTTTTTTTVVDPTMSPTPRGQVPKVCLSPYKRANLVYSGQHIHSSLSNSSLSVPTRKALFNSGDAVSTAGSSSSSANSSSRGSIDLGLLPSSSSPPLPMQREIVDKVKVALDEAMQSVKSRIIDEQLLTWAQPPTNSNTRRNYHYHHSSYNYYPPPHDASVDRPEIAASPLSGSQNQDQRYDESPSSTRTGSGRQMLRTSSSGVDQQQQFFPDRAPSYSPPPALASSPTSSPFATRYH